MMNEELQMGFSVQELAKLGTVMFMAFLAALLVAKNL